MATIDTISGLPAASTASSSSSSASARAQLNREDFYKIMISELSNQDPFEPLDNRQFLEQLASLQTLDTTGRLADGIDKLILQSQLSAASSLIGRDVKAPTVTVDPNGNPVVSEVQGKVERVSVQNGQVRLMFDGDRSVALAEVAEISG